jgi:hypothetical protein
MEDWGIQQEVPEHIIDAFQPIGSQFLTHIATDLPSSIRVGGENIDSKK